MSIRILSALLLTLFLTTGAIAQTVTLTLTNSEMKIDGTSNIRDWDANVKTLNVTFLINEMDEFSLTTLTPENFNSLSILMPVKDIESDTRGLTGNIQKYLKKDQHPIIRFDLEKIESIETATENDADILITALGTVTAAGVTSPVTMQVFAKENANGTVSFYGEQNLLMTSFNIDPPTAVMGTVRARDEFKVIYNLTLSKS
jgi:polyisoprenoid-binding protein YceI